jgi:hypothetical protein
MKTHEHLFGKKLAITLDNGEKIPRDAWTNSELIMEYSKTTKEYLTS